MENRQECTCSGFCNPEVANLALGVLGKLAHSRAPYPEAAYTLLLELRRQAAEALEAFDLADHDE